MVLVSGLIMTNFLGVIDFEKRRDHELAMIAAMDQDVPVLVYRDGKKVIQGDLSGPPHDSDG